MNVLDVETINNLTEVSIAMDTAKALFRLTGETPTEQMVEELAIGIMLENQS